MSVPFILTIIICVYLFFHELRKKPKEPPPKDFVRLIELDLEDFQRLDK